MKTLRETFNHSLLHDFWNVLSVDPDNKPSNKKRETEVYKYKYEMRDFFRVVKPVKGFGLQ